MRVLVLNNTYEPINVTSLARGFKLVFKGKAEIIEHMAEEPIVTSRRSYKRPTVIRLLRYIAVPFKKVALTRQNIYRRDDHKCIYCRTSEDLTLDHVIPKSKGGQNSWTNLATCCGTCNVKKGDMPLKAFLQNYNLTMHHEPFRPSYLYFIEKIQKVHESWKLYVGVAS